MGPAHRATKALKMKITATTIPVRLHSLAENCTDLRPNIRALHTGNLMIERVQASMCEQYSRLRSTPLIGGRLQSFVRNLMNSRALAGASRGSSELGPVRDPGTDIQAWDPAGETSSFLFDIPTLFRIVLRHRWVVLGIVGTCLLLAVAWAATQTPLYRATATLELNPSTRRVVQMSDSQVDPTMYDSDFLALQIGLLKSRSLAERVARKLNLGQNETFLGFKPDKNANAAAVGTLMGNFSATGTQSDRIVQLSYVHPNPGIAAQVVNTFAQEAVEANFERQYEGTARSRAFLQRQLEATRDKLERSERELIAYARAANIVNIVSEEGATNADSAGGTLVASNLLALNQQLAEAQNARITAQQRAAQAGASANSAAVADPTVQLLQQQQAQLQAEYQQKLSRYLPDHPEMTSLQARIQGLQREIGQARGRATSSVVGSLQAEATAARNREAQLQGKINQLQGQLLNLNDRGVKYTILRRAVEANRTLYNALLAKLGEENTAGTSSSNVAPIDIAETPGAPFAPNIPRALILALLGGLGLGVAAALALERWRDTINTPEDVRLGLRLSVLGVVPRLAKDEAVDDELRNPRSEVAEAYHSTRAALQTAPDGAGAAKSIMFTSSRPGEGKTTSVIALAADFISIGRTVCVVDADLRNPSIQGRRKDGGLAAVLSGRSTLDQEMAPTETPRLSLLHAGLPPHDPTVLLAGDTFRRLIEKLEQRFDLVIVDGPPVLGLADAPMIASCVETTVLVIEAGATRRAVAATALNRLLVGGAFITGAVLTKFDGKLHGREYSAYDYVYSHKIESPKRALIGPTTEGATA